MKKTMMNEKDRDEEDDDEREKVAIKKTLLSEKIARLTKKTMMNE